MTPPLPSHLLDPGHRWSPRLAHRVAVTAARARLEHELRAIALDLLGPGDPTQLPAATRAWVDHATEQVVVAVGDLSLSALVDGLERATSVAPPEVVSRLDESTARVEAGLI